MLSVTTDVIGRTITGSSIVGVLELNELLMVGCFLILAFTQKSGAHVSVELLLIRMSDQTRRKYEITAIALTLVTCIIFCWQSFVQVQAAIEMNLITEGVIQYPLWPAAICVFVGFLLLCIRLLFQLIDLLTRRIFKIEPEVR